MIPAQLLPLLGYDDYLGIAREGTVVVPVERRAVIGTITTRPKYRGTVTTTPKYLGHLSVRPRISTRGGGVISNAAALFAMQKAALFQDPLNTLDEFKAFIARFVAIINGETEIVDELRTYLLTEGRNNENMEDVFGLDELGAPHLLYWLNRKLRERQDVLVWTDRLSEIGWGEESPDNLGDADPFDLVTTLEGLGVDVLLCDAQAVDDGDAASLDGAVAIRTNNNNCYRINNATVQSGTIKTGGESGITASLFKGNGRYQYRLLGGFQGASTKHNNLRNLAEGGTTAWRYPDSTRPVVVLWRGGTVYDSTDLDLRFLKQDGSTIQCDYIMWRSYPGETAEINAGKLSATGMTGAFITGNNATRFRRNLWFDSMHFRFRAGTEGSYVFANRGFQVSSSSTGCRFLRCEFDNFKFISPDDDRADDYPAYVDSDFALKNATGQMRQTGVELNAKGSVIYACRFKPAGNELPRINDGGTDDPGHSVDLASASATDLATSFTDRFATISRCLFEGQAGHGQIRGQGGPRYVVIEDCDISNGDNSCIVGFGLTATPCTHFWIRRNRIHDWGTVVGAAGGANGVQMKSVSNWIVEDNVIWNPGTDDAISVNGVNISCDRFADNPSHANADDNIIRRNILYKCQSSMSISGGSVPQASDTRINDNLFTSNIIVDFDEDDKTGVVDAPVHIELYDPITNLLFGNAVTGNLIAYDTTYDAADPIATVWPGTGAHTDVTEANQATIPGFSGNFVANPGFASVGTGDFTPSLTAARNLLDLGAIPLVSTPQWNAA